MEFDSDLIEEIVKKWVLMGLEYEIDETYLLHKVAQINNLINNVLGDNLLPSCPIFIMSILQQIEANTPHNLGSGAYGFFYEVFITRALSNTSREIRLDTKYTYLSELAYYIFSKKVEKITRYEMESLYKYYCKEYKITPPYNTLLNDLIKASILEEYNGHYNFKYSYIYYYFIARYIRDNMSNQKIKNKVTYMSKKVHVEEFANIIVFLSYLSKDPFIIKVMLRNAKEILKDQKACDLEKDVEFLNKIYTKLPEIVFLDEATKGRKFVKELEKDEDIEKIEIGENDNFYEELFDKEEEEEIIEGDTVFEMNVAFKTIQILGQILKNFPGSLRGKPKMDIASECFLLGMRTLNEFFRNIEKDLDNIVSSFLKTLKDDNNIEDNELRDEIKKAIFCIIEMFSFIFIKRISSSVGNEELNEIYKDILDKFDTVANRLINMSIKLDLYTYFPEREVFDLFTKLKDNLLASRILVHMVCNYFYKFPPDYKLKQKVCSKLNIPIEKLRLLEYKSKKLKK